MSDSRQSDFVNKKRGADYSVDFQDSLLTKYQEKTLELEQLVSESATDDKLKEVEREIKQIRKALEEPLGRLNLAVEIKEKHHYREPKDILDLSLIEEEDNTSDSEKLGSAPSPKKPERRIILQPSKFTEETPKNKVHFSTPFSGQRENCRAKLEGLLQEEAFAPLTAENALASIRQQLKVEVKKEILDACLNQEEVTQQVNSSIREGVGLFGILRLVREKLQVFGGNREDQVGGRTSPLTCDRSLSFHSAGNTFVKENDTSSTRARRDDTLTSDMATIQMRGLSLKDALDLVPKYNGQNISLTQFLDGCSEAATIIPPAYEKEFTKLLRIRLYGDALDSIRGQEFENIAEISEFLETTFGSAKTYHEWEGELAKIKQGSSESVNVFHNRLKEIEREIFKAARRERRIRSEDEFREKLEEDCIKFFLKGLRWEIRARIGRPAKLKEAREAALEVEREYAGSEAVDDSRAEGRIRAGRETKKVHIIDTVIEDTRCAFCQKAGHAAFNCEKFIAIIMSSQHRPPDNKLDERPSDDRGPRNTSRPSHYGNFGGWNAENRRRVEFLPSSDNIHRHPNRNDYRGNTVNANQGPGTRYNNRYPDSNNYNYPSRSYNNNYAQGSQGSNGNNFSRPSFSGNNSRFSRSNPEEPNDTSAPSCFYCGRRGHIQRNCFKFQNDSRRGTPTNQGNSADLSPTGAQRETQHGTRPTATGASAVLSSPTKQ